MSEHTPDEDWKVLNDWACSPETTELDHKADAFAEHPELSIFTPKSAAKGFYVGWVTGYAKVLIERDEARATLDELVKAIDKHGGYVLDHACKQCVGNQAISDTFVCAYHKAKALHV